MTLYRPDSAIHVGYRTILWALLGKSETVSIAENLMRAVILIEKLNFSSVYSAR